MCCSCHDRLDGETDDAVVPPPKRPRVHRSPDSLHELLAEGDLLVHTVRGASVATDPSQLVIPGVGSSLWVAARGLLPPLLLTAPWLKSA